MNQRDKAGSVGKLIRHINFAAKHAPRDSASTQALSAAVASFRRRVGSQHGARPTAKRGDGVALLDPELPEPSEPEGGLPHLNHFLRSPKSRFEPM